MLSSELYNKKIDKKEKLTEEEEMAIIKIQAKMRRDAIDAYKKAGANDKAAEENKELAILKEFLPKEMSDTELEKIVIGVIKETGASEISDMGKVMGAVMKKTKGTADGNRVSEIVKSKLS